MDRLTPPALVDEMFLLGSTVEGRHALRDLPTLVGGAALTDLALRARVSCPSRTVEVDDRTPTGHPALDGLLDRIASTRRAHTPWRWVFDSARPIIAAEREHLVDAGVLGMEQDTLLGMLPRTRHPVVDADLRQSVVDRVRDVVLPPRHATIAVPQPGGSTSAEPGEATRTRLLVSLLATAYHSRRTAEAIVPELDGRTLRTRLKDAGVSHWAVAGTAHAVRLANAARA